MKKKKTKSKLEKFAPRESIITLYAEEKKFNRNS